MGKNTSLNGKEMATFRNIDKEDLEDTTCYCGKIDPLVKEFGYCTTCVKDVYGEPGVDF